MEELISPLPCNFLLCVPVQWHLLFSHIYLHKPDQKQNQYFHLLGRGTVCGIQGRRQFQKPSCSPEDKSCHCVSFKFLRLWSCKRSNRIRSWMVDFECRPSQGIMMWRWCGEVWSTECSFFPLQASWRIWETNLCVQTAKHKGFCSWLGRRFAQSSPWHTAGQVLTKAGTESLVLILAVLMTHKMDFVNSPHPPQGDGDHTCLLWRTVLPSLLVWYGIRGCMKYGHHFMTFKMVDSWWNPSVNI